MAKVEINIGNSILQGPEGKRGPAGSIKSNSKPSTTDTVVWVDTSKDAPDRVLELGQIMALEKKYEKLIQNETSQSPSDAEIVDARGDFDLLSGRLNDNDIKVKAKPYYFNTVAEMKSSKHLKDGDCAITLGYYSANDGGNATYKIRTKTSSDVDDGGSIHYIGTDLVAELIIENGTVNVKQFGAKGDGETDDTQAIQKTLDKFKSVFIPKGIYNITNTIDIIDNIIDGENSTIKTISQTANREHQIHVEGSSTISNIIFLQSNQNTSLCGLFNNNTTTFNECQFIVDNVKTNGYVDLYHNNKNVHFNNCLFEIDSYNSSGNLDIGGVWIRESTENYTTSNIYMNNCIINHNSIDESIAAWDWNGKVKNIFIECCTFNAKDTCTSPHFISFDCDNCIMDNCIINGPTLNSNSIFKGNFFNKVNNCKIFSHTDENNGISSGNIIFMNCYISNDSNKCYLSTNSLNKYVNCDISVKGIIDTRKIEMYNCKIDINGENTGRAFNLDAKIIDCEFNVKKCLALFSPYSKNSLNIILKGNIFNISSGYFLFFNDFFDVANSIIIINNYITKCDIYIPDSGTNVKGCIASNIVNKDITTIENVIIENNVTIN